MTIVISIAVDVNFIYHCATGEYMSNSSSITKQAQAATGVIVEVHGPVVVIACDTLPSLRQALYTRFDNETCLFANLHALLYTSLMEQNHKRVTHLDGAVRHLDDQLAQLAQQCNVLRQEEIIEEIEVILLSAASINE